MKVAGVIEGFYGPPWTHEERLDLIAFCGRHGLNAWVHAPKDDRYHRARWREPYPDEDLARFAELVAAAGRNGVELAWAVAPGLDVCCSRDSELEALLAKCEQLRSAGVRRFQLLWDDIEHELHCPEDGARFAGAERPSAAAHAAFSNRVARELTQAGPLVVCPTGYAGTEETAYRRVLRETLDPEVVVYWTGPEVVSYAVAREELDAAVHRFGGRELLLWDNYPVNDFDPERLFLGPLRGRDPRLAEALQGIVANGMLQAVPSKLALATLAEWVRDPQAYEPVAAFERAVREHGAEVVEALRRLTPRPADLVPPGDVPALVDALAFGVDAATALALLGPFA